MKKQEFFSNNPPLTFFESWQVKNGLNKYIRPKDYAIVKYLKLLNYKKAKTILDFGCANGLWLERVLKGIKAKGIGVDVSDELIKIANERKNRRGKYFDSSTYWPIKDNSVDLCFSFDVVEHLRNRKMELSKVSKSIKKNGKILIFTLNPNNKYTFDWIFEKLGSNWLYNRSDHLKSRFVSPETLSKELKAYGFIDINYELYPGPFNLFMDVLCYGLLKLIESIFGIKGESLLNFNSRASEFFYKINLPFDKLFYKKGYSNGYFIWATKK